MIVFIVLRQMWFYIPTWLPGKMKSKKSKKQCCVVFVKSICVFHRCSSLLEDDPSTAAWKHHVPVEQNLLLAWQCQQLRLNLSLLSVSFSIIKKKKKLQFQLSALLGCQAASGDPTKACNLASTIGCGVTCRFRVRMTPDGWGSPTVGKLGKIWVWAANGHSILALRKRECGHRVPHFGSHGTTISVPLCCWRMTARTRPRCPRSWDLGTLNSPRKCGITGSTSWYIERSSATLPGIPKGSPPTGGHIIVWTATARCRERKVTAKPLERWAWHRLMEERDWRSWHGL